MKKLLVFIIIIFATFSCNENFLDRTPYSSLSSSVIWNSDEYATMAVNGIYNTFSQTFWPNFFHYITNIGPTGYTLIRSGDGINHYSGLATSNDGIFATTYRALYRVIIYSNDVIANVPGNPNITPELGDRLVGEAKFYRGLSYFYLWRLFGGVIILNKPHSIEETYLPRNSADEVKQLVISDFTDAIQNLPVTYDSSDEGRVTKGAAIAMLGKTYLYDNQWIKASEQFEKLMGSPYEYELTDEFSDNFFSATEFNSETVFDLQYIGIEGYGSMVDNRYGYRNHGPNYGEDYSTASNISVEIYTNIDGTPIDRSAFPDRNDYTDESEYGVELMNWYQTAFSNADPRLHKSVILPGSDFNSSIGVQRLYWPTGTASDNPPGIRTTWPSEATIPIRKMVSEGNDCPINHNCPLNWPMIRYADILLMYAEAKNEGNGPSSDVYDAVNAIRNRAGVTDLPSGLSKDEMRINIRLERFREFLFETHEYFDVIRWRTAHTDDPIFGLNHDILDFRYVSKLGTKVFREDRDYLWPIPQGEIDLNPLVEQNPNW
jgi:hypothetical protein